MECLRIPVLALILLLCIIGSDGYDEINQASPSPSPGPAVNWDFQKEQILINGSKEANCDNVVTKCIITDYGITACVPFVWNLSEAARLLVVNNDSNDHDIRVFVLPTDVSTTNITIPGHNAKQVSLPFDKEREIQSIVLRVENKSCTLQIESLIPSRFSPDHLTPMHGVYLFIAVSIFVGCGLLCFKVKKMKQRNLNGVPYQELEMGQHEPEAKAFVIESPSGWDENWDDDWDEEKAVRSPGARKILQNRNGGGSLKYVDTSQWRNDWDE